MEPYNEYEIMFSTYANLHIVPWSVYHVAFLIEGGVLLL